MRDHQFHSTEETTQINAAWEQGVFLTERKNGFHKMMLYQVDDYYVEVTYHTHFNVILQVANFTDTDYLEPYFNQINIDHLFSPHC